MRCATDWLLFASFSFGQTWYNFHIFPSWLPYSTDSCHKQKLIVVLLAKACPSGRLTWNERWTFEGTTHIVYIKLQKNIRNAQHHITSQKNTQPLPDTPKRFALKNPQLPFEVHNVYMIDYFLFLFFLKLFKYVSTCCCMEPVEVDTWHS